MKLPSKPLFVSLSVVLLPLLFSACFEPFEGVRERDPLIPREIIPVDSLVVDKGEALTISIRFNRPARIDELNVHVFPKPLGEPAVHLSPTGHTAYFDNLRFDPEKNIHYLFVDGAEVLQPQLRRYWDGDTGVAAVTGWIGTTKPQATRGAKTAVFLMELDTDFRPSAPESFANARPFAVELPVWSIYEGALSFRFGDLPPAQFYFLLAVADVNEDGVYDPSVDWWGTHADPNSDVDMLPVEATVSNFLEPRRMYRFNLHPPVPE